MKRFAYFSAALLFLAAACCGKTWAGATVASTNGAVWLGNTLVMRVSPPGVGNLVVHRLDKALLRGAQPSQIWVERYGRSYTLNFSSLPIIQVTPFRARLNHTSPRSLALLWAGRLKTALTRGIYLATPSHLTIPYGESRTLQIIGRYPGSLSVEVEDPNVSKLASGAIPLVFNGLNPGKTTVRISVGNLSASTEIYVKQWAGSVPRKIMLTVTGTEVPRSFLDRAILSHLKNEITTMPDASLSVRFPVHLLPLTLISGQNMVFPVKATLSGNNYLTLNKTLMMQIADKPFAPQPAAFLAVSNNPENFTAPGLLFDRQLPDGKAVRIFFHHHNKGTAPYELVLQAKNASDRPALLHVIRGIGGPDTSELQVGEVAAYDFFLALQDRLGEVIQINPGETYTLVTTRVPPDESISGVLLLTPMSESGGKISLETMVQSIWNQKSGRLPVSLNPEEKAKPKGIFPNPEITIHANYTIGKDYAFIEIGKDGNLVDPETGQPDFGNYGAFYTVNITITNPSDEPKAAHIMFVPQGGESSGVFLIDGNQLVQVPPTLPFSAYPLVKLNLNPGESRSVTLETMPEGGAFYPVDLVAEP